jgi:hypothetical protein
MTMKNNNLIFAIFAGALIAIFAGCSEKKSAPQSEISITSLPEQAKVLYNGKEIGVTPFKTKTKPGSYIFGFEKKNFKDRFVKAIAADGESKNIEVQLEEISSSIMIESSPAEVFVEIDGRQIGQTPMTLHGQTIGQHKATLKKPGMVQQEVSWTVEDARPQLVKVNLFTNMGVIKINASPANAQITIDDKPKGKAPFSENIEQGEHTILIEASGYKKHEQTIVIERSKDCVINVALNVQPGTLSINSTPPGATIFVNDAQNETTPLTITDLQPGKYTIRAEKNGYDNSTREVELGPDGKAEINIILDTNMGGIDLVVNPPGVTIYLDGKQIGVSQVGEEETLSKIFPVRNLKNGAHAIKVSHKRAIPSDRTIDVSVEKGKISRPTPINVWIADAVLKLKNGKVLKVKLMQKNEKEILFQPEPGVTLKHEIEEVEAVVPLKPEEDWPENATP